MWYFGKLTTLEKENFIKQITYIDIEVFAMFGTLLGIIRDNDLIYHDTDVDLCFLSKYTKKEDVITETISIYNQLHANNMLIKYWNKNYVPADLNNIQTVFGQAHIKINGYIFDLFTCWRDDDGRFWHCPFGLLANSITLKEITFFNNKIKVPVNAVEILDNLYGDWTIPCKKKSSLLKRCWLYENNSI